jgi:hypothetical protein
VRYGAFSWNETIKLQVQRKGRSHLSNSHLDLHKRTCAVPIRHAESPSLDPPQTQGGCLVLSAEIAAAPPRPS